MIEYLELMPEDASKDVVPQNYQRLLPKEEAPCAVVVGSLAWTFVVFFLVGLIALDLSNLVRSIMLFIQRMAVLIRMASVIAKG